jgi:TrmH family RNA methyltransferase
MLTKNRIREIHSLENKKERKETGLFKAEGVKIITDLLASSIVIETIYTIPEYTGIFEAFIPGRPLTIIQVSETEIGKMSHMITPQGCLAICRIPTYSVPGTAGLTDLVLCIDDIQDPGNFGTILRMADWFGISDVFCSPGTADIYNPKVVQATMGAICRVRIHYQSLVPFVREKMEKGIPIYGTLLEGNNLFNTELTEYGIIIFGNEGKGIKNELLPMITRKITIPSFHSGEGKPDSLNVSVAASIVVSEFRRRSLTGHGS